MMSGSGVFFLMSVKKFLEKGIILLFEEEKMSMLYYLENVYY